MIGYDDDEREGSPVGIVLAVAVADVVVLPAFHLRIQVAGELPRVDTQRPNSEGEVVGSWHISRSIKTTAMPITGASR